MKNKVVLKFILLFLMIFVVSITANIRVHAQNTATNVHYVHADYEHNYNTAESIIDLFDYCFKGVIVENVGVSQFNGNGFDIPYTFFRVRVTEQVKGVVNREVIIKFYGGFNQKNELILLEGSELPVIGGKYTFYCDQTKTRFRDDGRTIDDSYVIICPEALVKEKGGKPVSSPDTSKTKTTTKEPLWLDNNNVWGLELLARQYPPDDGNLSFGTAYYIDLNIGQEVEIRSGTPKYWKIDRNTLDYLCIYSVGHELDTIVYLYIYDGVNGYQMLDLCDDVSGRGWKFTDDANFFLNFYADKNTTYYFKVSTFVPQTGLMSLYCQIDNYYKSDYNLLVRDRDCVDSGKKIHYTDHTSFQSDITAAAGEWNKLNRVQILKDTSSTTNDVDIYTRDWGDNGILAITTGYLLFAWKIEFNSYFFNTMTSAERMKTIMHEFGHCLGFNEFSGDGYAETIDNVMVQGRRAQTTLGPADIAVYRKKWGQ